MDPIDIAPAAKAIVQTTNGGSIRAASWITAVVSVIGVISLVIKQWGPWQIIAGQQRRADIEGMGKRIAELEARLDKQTSEYAAKIEQKDVAHAAEIQVMRHRMNNIDQCFTMLLALIELDPSRAAEAATRVRQMRERQEANEAAEKSTITAARIAPASVTASEE